MSGEFGGRFIAGVQLEIRKNLVILARAAVTQGARAKIGVCGA